MSKSVKANPILLNRVTYPLFVLFILIGMLANPWIYRWSQYQYVWLLYALCLALLPRSWATISSTIQKEKHPGFYRQIFSLQLAIITWFIAWYSALQTLVPQFSPPKMSEVMMTGWVHWGLFPWPLFAIATVLFAILFHQQQKPMTMATILEKVFPKKWLTIPFIIDIANRLVVGFMIGITLLVLVLTLVNFLLGWLLPPIQFGIRGEYLVIFVMVSALPISDKKLKRIQLRFVKNNTVAQWLRVLFFKVFLIYFAVHLVSGLLTKFAIVDPNLLLESYPLFDPNIKNVCLPLLLWSWWLGWIRVYSGLVAEYCAHRHIGEIVFAHCLLPGTIALLCVIARHLNPHFGFDFSMLHHQLILVPFLILCLWWFYQVSDKQKRMGYLMFCGEVDSSAHNEEPRLYTMIQYVKSQASVFAIYCAGLEIVYLIASWMLFSYLWFILIALTAPLYIWKLQATNKNIGSELCL